MTKPLPYCTLGLLTLLSCQSAPTIPSPALARFEFDQVHMAVPFRIVLYATNRAAAQTAAGAAFARVEQLNRILSDYDLESELSQLSRSSGQGVPRRVSDDLWRVLRKAQQLAQRTGGAFDVTAGPAINLWRKARREHRLPTPGRLERALAAMGYRHVRLDPASQTAELLLPEMRLDLGGIAKGYAVDQALLTLQTNGITRALVAGAGDMAALGPPPEKPGWRIEVAPPENPEAPPPIHVLLQNGALATSGDVFQFLEIDGVRYSHILDPRTGIGLTNQSLVTVLAPDCATADSLATTLSVLGPEQGLPFLSQIPGTDAYFVFPTNGAFATARSPGFNQLIDPAAP